MRRVAAGAVEATKNAHDERARVILRAWRSGILAATVAEELPAVRNLIADQFTGFQVRLRNWSLAPWLESASLAVGRAPTHQMQHVLLKMVPWFYRARPTEGKVIGGFIAARLADNLVHEWECKDDDATLLEWLDHGVEFGRKVLAREPELVAGRVRRVGAEVSHVAGPDRARRAQGARGECGAFAGAGAAVCGARVG
jgi:hypothetical protein